MLRHERVHKTPANRGIKEFRLTLVRRAGFSHHERRTRHRFHAAGNQQLGIAGFDRPGGKADGIQTRSAQAVNRGARHGMRVTGQQRRHVRHVAVIFPGLIRTAENHIINCCRVEPGITTQELTQRDCRQVVGAHTGQRAAVAANRRTDPVTNKGVAHYTSPVIVPPMRCDLPRNRATIFCC